MTITKHPALDPGPLRRTGDLRALGVVPAAPRYRQVRRGVWLPDAAWQAMTLDQRQAARVHATALVCAPDHEHAFARSAAAALWGMPRVTAWPERIDVIVAGRSAGDSRIVRRHPGDLADTVLVAGLRVTAPARTVIDLARYDTFENALAAADHALRHELCAADELRRQAAALPPRARGVRVARVVAALADGGSMSAGESLSRAQMFRLQFPRPVLQQACHDEQGLIGYTDFAWAGVVGEFDGRLKYGIPDDTPRERAAEVLWREKLREDRLRRLARVARWVWADARDPVRLARILAAVGVRPQPRGTWLDPPPHHEERPLPREALQQGRRS